MEKFKPNDRTYKSIEGQIITGTVRKVEGDNVYIESANPKGNGYITFIENMLECFWSVTIVNSKPYKNICEYISKFKVFFVIFIVITKVV